LNSERRRANRRKPGKAALIAQAKKEQLAEKGKFNAVGYQKRKGGAGGSSSWLWSTCEVEYLFDMYDADS
jgi:hypothetical protein